MTYRRVPLTRVTITRYPGRDSRLQAYDANGHLRSQTDGTTDYLARKAAEWWPDIRVEYKDHAKSDPRRRRR